MPSRYGSNHVSFNMRDRNEIPRCKAARFGLPCKLTELNCYTCSPTLLVIVLSIQIPSEPNCAAIWFLDYIYIGSAIFHIFFISICCFYVTKCDIGYASKLQWFHYFVLVAFSLFSPNRLYPFYYMPLKINSNLTKL